MSKKIKVLVLMLTIASTTLLTLSLEKIFSTIRKEFKDKFGSELEIDFKETDYFEPHIPGIVSKIDKSQIKKKKYV